MHGVVYDLLLQSGWQTAQTFAQNDRPLQGTPGAIAVLHTNTRRLDDHPHVHLVLPAAAVDDEQTGSDRGFARSNLIRWANSQKGNHG